jgi:hypothetical protein
MNLGAEIVLSILPWLIGGALTLGLMGILGWIFTTWLRVKHGYPLDNAWGKSVYPRTADETTERVRLMGQENAQLRAELASIKDRLVTVERIVTDGSYRLDQEINGLRGPTN